VFLYPDGRLQSTSVLCALCSVISICPWLCENILFGDLFIREDGLFVKYEHNVKHGL
jgi:hypothetical protein